MKGEEGEGRGGRDEGIDERVNGGGRLGQGGRGKRRQKWRNGKEERGEKVIGILSCTKFILTPHPYIIPHPTPYSIPHPSPDLLLTNSTQEAS